MSHVTYEWVMSHMNESCHIWMSDFTYESVMSHMNESHHIWMSHVTYEWVMSHMNESCLTHEWESCRKYEWATHMNVSSHTYKRVKHATRINEWDIARRRVCYLTCRAFSIARQKKRKKARSWNSTKTCVLLNLSCFFNSMTKKNKKTKLK